MTTATRAAPNVVREPTYDQVRKALAALRGLVERLPLGAGTAADCEAVRQFLEPWLPIAQARLRKAEGSPSDQARWEALIAKVRRPHASNETELDLVTLCMAARRLLLAVLEATRSGPSACEIAGLLREGITRGVYAPGSILAAGRITAEMDLAQPSAERVRLAFHDLKDEGLVTLSRSSWVRVNDWKEPTGHVARVADWLRVLIQEWVYPPATHLPETSALARALVAPERVVTKALSLLHSDGTISVYHRACVLVRSAPSLAAGEPRKLGALLGRLRAVPVPEADLGHTGIREACRRGHAWWHSRVSPHPETLVHTHGVLVAAVVHLIPPAAELHWANSLARSAVLRAAITALADLQDESDGRLWRTACLATACLDVLTLADGAASGPTPSWTGVS
ncbi:GntR family transcriptional regulator [Streptomyces murinus]|uniref:GntR family transcriptional regulator n=1 Tax=Streptomyces murinus TaxID=33900 RepID=UPI003F45A0CC